MRVWIFVPIIAIAVSTPLYAAEQEQPKIDLTKCGRGVGDLRACRIAEGQYVYITEPDFQTLAKKYNVDVQ